MRIHVIAVLAAALVAATGGACTEDPEPTSNSEITPRFHHRPGHGSPGGDQKENDPRAIFEYPADDGALKIRSDRRQEFLSGAAYVYDDGVCGVTVKIFATGSGDAVMDPDGAQIRGRDREACGDPRFITVLYDQPASGDPPPDPLEAFGTFHNMNDLWSLAVGELVDGAAGFNTPRCSVLRFKPAEYPGSDNVEILRVDDSTWEIRTKPFPDDKAYCGNENRFYHLPFRLTVRVK